MNSRALAFWGASAAQWNDWRWQVRNALRTQSELDRALRLTRAERRALRKTLRLPVAVTPYYAEFLRSAKDQRSLRRLVLPYPGEDKALEHERADPLGEDRRRPCPCVVHTYPDRALFLVTDRCPVYCRFCTRARLLERAPRLSSSAEWERGLRYIRSRKRVREVIVSGGEPLLLSDERLREILAGLRKIPHVEIIRLSTRVPAVLPQRVTPQLVSLLARFKPLWVSVHFAHPRELTPEAVTACKLLADAGIPMVSQTVLLRGINDRFSILRDLMWKLLRLGIKPYYLHQCDAGVGLGAFRARLDKAEQIQRGLYGHTSGLAVPLLMLDPPGGGGKVPLVPQYVLGRRDSRLYIGGRNGVRHVFPLASDDAFMAFGDRRHVILNSLDARLD